MLPALAAAVPWVMGGLTVAQLMSMIKGNMEAGVQEKLTDKQIAFEKHKGKSASRTQQMLYDAMQREQIRQESRIEGLHQRNRGENRTDMLLQALVAKMMNPDPQGTAQVAAMMDMRNNMPSAQPDLLPPTSLTRQLRF